MFGNDEAVDESTFLLAANTQLFSSWNCFLTPTFRVGGPPVFSVLQVEEEPRGLKKSTGLILFLLF